MIKVANYFQGNKVLYEEWPTQKDFEGSAYRQQIKDILRDPECNSLTIKWPKYTIRFYKTSK